MEASSAPWATRCSNLGGAVFASVGKKPNVAKPSPPKTKTAAVIVTPRMNLRMGPPGRLFWPGRPPLDQVRSLSVPDASGRSREQSDMQWNRSIFAVPLSQSLEQLPRQIEADEQPARFIRRWILEESRTRASPLRNYRSRPVG